MSDEHLLYVQRANKHGQSDLSQVTPENLAVFTVAYKYAQLLPIPDVI